MARINIEECWWSDVRRSALIKLLGSEDSADVAAIRMWRLAQEFWGRGRSLIPEKIWQHVQAGSKLIQAGLAEERDGGVYVRGSSQYLDWVNEQREKASIGGKKSAQRPRDAKGRLKKTSKQSPSRVQANSKQIQASYSGSFSGSDSSSDSGSGSLPISAKSANPVKIYCDLWKERNGKSPDIRPKEAGQLTKLVADVGIGRTLQIIKSYFAMPNPLFIQRGYDVGTMLLNLAAIAQFEASGKVVTREVIKQVEKQVDKIQGTKTRRTIGEIEAEQKSSLSIVKETS